LNRRIRIGITIALIGIILVGVGIFIVYSLFRSMVTPAPVATPVPVAMRRVVVATRDLAIGTLFRAEDLNTIDVPVDIAPRDAIGDSSSVVGRMSKVALVSGEMVLNHHLADPTNVNRDMAFVLDEELVLMAVPATDLMSNLNMIDRGDVIDVLASLTEEVPVRDVTGQTQFTEEEETLSRLFTFSAMQRVGISGIVIEVIDSSATEEDANRSNLRTRAYLLALDPQDALVLKHLKDAGATFDYVLRAPSSTQLFDLQPVISEYLIQKYELEVTR
jgi:pilus assembly protein CpaB